MPEALLITACRSHGMPFGMLSTGANAQATESHAAMSRHSTQHSCAQPIQSEAVDREAAASPMHRCNCACDISMVDSHTVLLRPRAVEGTRQAVNTEDVPGCVYRVNVRAQTQPSQLHPLS